MLEGLPGSAVVRLTPAELARHRTTVHIRRMHTARGTRPSNPRIAFMLIVVGLKLSRLIGNRPRLGSVVSSGWMTDTS